VQGLREEADQIQTKRIEEKQSSIAQIAVNLRNIYDPDDPATSRLDITTCYGRSPRVASF
jgi:hypothetical protein